MGTFSDYLNNWDQNRGNIYDNNFFYFSDDLQNIVAFQKNTIGIPVEIASLYENVVRVSYQTLTEDRKPSGIGIEAKVLCKLYVSADLNENNLQVMQSAVKDMLEYCINNNLPAVWTNTVMKPIARHDLD